MPPCKEAWLLGPKGRRERSCPRGQASPMSTEAEGWSRDHGPGLALSCPRACYGHSVGTRSQTGLGLRRETQVSPGGSRSHGRQGRGATKAAAGGSQRGVSPHRCPSQTPCPGTQRMPPSTPSHPPFSSLLEPGAARAPLRPMSWENAGCFPSALSVCWLRNQH